jgi:hypothetical protein
MSMCSDECRKPTGARMEHCLVCHQTFAGHTIADAHRVDNGTYVLASDTLTSSVRRFPTELAVPTGWKVSSVGNALRRCLTAAEMSAKGWRLDGGVWRGAQIEGPGWWEAEPDADLEANA